MGNTLLHEAVPGAPRISNVCECDFSFGWVEMYMRSCGKDMGYLEYISAGCDGYRWIHDSTH